MAGLIQRMMGAAKLNVSTYEDVEADASANGQALVVVVLSSIAAGVGFVAGTDVYAIIIRSIAALLSWFTWAFLTYLIGTRLLPEAQTRSNFGELLRTIGFSSSPGVLRILGVVPLWGRLVSPVIFGCWLR